MLIDRDGTLILEKHYLSDLGQLELIAGAAPALKRLQDAGWGMCLVTNQAGVARGFFDLAQLGVIHQRLEEMLARFGVRLDGIYICPHEPSDECSCRKPMPGMVYQAIDALGLDPKQAWVVGDKEIDVGLGIAVGARTILVRTGYGKQYENMTKANFVADDLAAAVDLILEQERAVT